MNDKPFTFVSDVDDERLDRFLDSHCPDLSRSRIQALINDGSAKLDGRVAKPSTKIRRGQTVIVLVPEPAKSSVEPQDIPLSIVYEDAQLLVVDKPAGMTVHPAPGHPDGTLVNALLAHCTDLQGVGGTVRPGIVHRLDKDTSGLLVVAKNDKAHRSLSAQFKSRKITKVYIALAQGSVKPNEAIIDAPVGRSGVNRQRMTITERGRVATTRYRVLRHFEAHSLLEVHLRTGRTHQIRVHFASLGFPIVGDATYGRPDNCLKRHFLHAGKLGFRHPVDGSYREFTSPLPEELRQYLQIVEA